MILLIDAGNTRAKLAWMGTVPGARSTPPLTLDYADLDATASRLPGRPQRILAANVAGAAVGQALEQICRHLWNLPIQWCGTHDGQALLHNGYDSPDALGADRWVGLLGLLQHLAAEPEGVAPTSCILASFGTATTVDTIRLQDRADGRPAARFQGGLILPGVAMMAHSLASGTAQLPLASGPCSDFPTDTPGAIASGIGAAQGGALVRQWQLARSASGGPPCVFVTGGSWAIVQDEVRAALSRSAGPHAPPLRWLEAPVLDGLAWIAGQSGAARATRQG